jgi:hypothetical protein
LFVEWRKYACRAEVATKSAWDALGEIGIIGKLQHRPFDALWGGSALGPIRRGKNGGPFRFSADIIHDAVRAASRTDTNIRYVKTYSRRAAGTAALGFQRSEKS